MCTKIPISHPNIECFDLNIHKKCLLQLFEFDIQTLSDMKLQSTTLYSKDMKMVGMKKIHLDTSAASSHADLFIQQNHQEKGKRIYKLHGS
jgi:hypothetical protein